MPYEAEFVSFLLKQMRYRERVIFEPFAPDLRHQQLGCPSKSLASFQNKRTYIVFVNKVQ